MFLQPYKSILIFILLMASHLSAFYMGYGAYEKSKPSILVFEQEKTVKSAEQKYNKNNTDKKISNSHFKKEDYKPELPSYFPTVNNLRTAIEHMHPNQLNSYLSKYFESDDLDNISDREAFAKRLIDLYSGEEESSQEQPIFAKGEIAVGTTEHYPAERVNIFSIQKNARLYAHVKLDDSASLLSEVFIKWERISDNKLLLFEKKMFDATRYENWVSIIPQGGWRDGEYQISFYHFNAQMTQIASYTYYLNEVWDISENLDAK
jgi:hypothetical protein